MQTTKFIQLEEELDSYKPAMSASADKVVEEDISKYPIMVIHKDEVNIGIPIINRTKVKGNWSVNVSTLEEFVQKKLIQSHKVDSFRTIYKNKDKYICCFVLSELGAQFIFIKRSSSTDS